MLFQDNPAFLIEKGRDEEVEDILNEVGVMHPMVCDGYDICEQTKQGLDITTLPSRSRHPRTFLPLSE